VAVGSTLPVILSAHLQRQQKCHQHSQQIGFSLRLVLLLLLLLLSYGSGLGD
jgi:hypothetical protein